MHNRGKDRQGSSTMASAKQIRLLLLSPLIGVLMVDFILILVFIQCHQLQGGRLDLRVETSLGPVIGEEKWGWDSRFNQEISYTAYTVGSDTILK